MMSHSTWKLFRFTNLDPEVVLFTHCSLWNVMVYYWFKNIIHTVLLVTKNRWNRHTAMFFNIRIFSLHVHIACWAPVCLYVYLPAIPRIPRDAVVVIWLLEGFRSTYLWWEILTRGVHDIGVHAIASAGDCKTCSPVSLSVCCTNDCPPQY